MTKDFSKSLKDGGALMLFYEFKIMRGLTRVLVMLAPMIIRNVSKYWRQYQSKKQQESYTQEPYNEVEDKRIPEEDAYKKDDLV